jgi:peptidyl-prolyl cis-trans isomerase B (cyclophilin B)
MADVKAKVDEALKSIDLNSKVYTAELKTNKGPIRLEFLPDVAPGHVKNFIALAKIGYYNGLGFHRIISGFMIQGGCPEGTGGGGPGYTIKAEFNATPHVAGVLSMARTSDPNSAGSQFFICLGTHTHLDRQYTAFGKTADAESLATVKAIGSVPVGAQDRPREKVVMETVTISERAK